MTHIEEPESAQRKRMSLQGTNQLREAFAAFLPLPAKLEPRLRDALQHILRNEGSLVRPQMVVDLCSAYDFPRTNARHLAIALEYFHTASLIFDDMPCMDDAVERRGAPCVHIEYGEAGAILAALALINRAYGLVWRAVAVSPMQRQTQALEFVEEHLGVSGLLNGQSLDLNYFDLPHDLATTERVAMGKTVSLIRLTLVLPAMIGGAPEREIQLLDHIAVYWGLSYQIVDDLKDVLQGVDETGKTSSRDISLDRPNIALGIGVSAALARLGRLIRLGDRALALLLRRRPAAAFLKTLRSSLQEEMLRVTESACEGRVQGTS